MISLIIPILLIVFAIIMSYAYIRLAIAKEKENELFKKKLDIQQQTLFDDAMIKDLKNTIDNLKTSNDELIFRISGKDLIGAFNRNVDNER